MATGTHALIPLQVLKNGTILEARPIADKDHYTFGRSPTADFPLEHPSASRLHFVIQYNGATGEAFAYDASSTHGTFLNRNRLKPRVFAPLKCVTAYGSRVDAGSCLAMSSEFMSDTTVVVFLTLRLEIRSPETVLKRSAARRWLYCAANIHVFV